MNDEKVVNLVDYIEKKESLKTLSSINLNQEDSSFLIKRIYSYTIDVSCIFTLHAALITSFAVFVSDFFHLSSMNLKVQLLSVSLPYQLAIFITSYMGYFMFTQSVLDGQTLGQKIYGLKVCDEQGNIKSDLKTTTLRSVGYLSYYLGCGFFHSIYFMNKNKRSFSDILSNTVINSSSLNHHNNEVLEIEIESLNEAA